jgi:hypothetical protein
MHGQQNIKKAGKVFIVFNKATRSGAAIGVPV